MLSNACLTLVPCLSNHMNLSKYDRSWLRWHPFHPLQFSLHQVLITRNVNTCHWILEMKGMIHCLVSGYIGQPFKPHELIQIRRNLTAVAPLHPLQFSLYPDPIALNVNTCHWILEMKGMIHHLVSGYIGQRPNIDICPPLITPDLSVGFHVIAQVIRVWRHPSVTTCITPKAGLWDVSTRPNTHTGVVGRHPRWCWSKVVIYWVTWSY